MVVRGRGGDEGDDREEVGSVIDGQIAENCNGFSVRCIT